MLDFVIPAQLGNKVQSLSNLAQVNSTLCNKSVQHSWMHQVQHSLRIDLIQRFYNAVPDLKSTFDNSSASAGN